MPQPTAITVHLAAHRLQLFERFCRERGQTSAGLLKSVVDALINMREGGGDPERAAVVRQIATICGLPCPPPGEKATTTRRLVGEHGTRSNRSDLK